MLSYITRRLLLLIPTLLGITLVVFLIMAMSPGVPGGAIDTEGLTDSEQARAVREFYRIRYGLDRSLPERYGRWLNAISPVGFDVQNDGSLGPLTFKQPNLGHSIARGRPVADLIAEALPITLLLNALSIPLVYAIAIVSGIYAARRRGGWFDVSTGVAYLGLWSLPMIWTGVMLIGFLANSQYLKWFPAAGLHGLEAGAAPFLPIFADGRFVPGWLMDTAWHLVLPVLCLSYGGFAFLSRLTRGTVLENLQADFVRTARAKGVGRSDVLWRHVFRNSLLPLITVAAFLLPGMLSGSVIVESIFSVPGMGKLAVDAVYTKDQDVVMATSLIGGLLGLVSYLIADVLYAVADPRVSYE